MRRLFLGCPIPASVATRIEEWARQELEGVRLVPPENLHVTLMFFGEAPAETGEALAALTREAAWAPLPVTTSDLTTYGRSALGLELVAPPGPQEALEDRVRFSVTAPRGQSDEKLREWAGDEWRRREADPLYRMALRLPKPEITRFRRRDRQGQGWPLHVTIARSRAGFPAELLAKRFPKTAFTLDRLVLYESRLAPSGASYEIVAEAGCER